MSGIWNRIKRALRESEQDDVLSSEKDALLSYIGRKYGEHEADEIAGVIDSMWNPEGLKALSAQLTGAFADEKIAKILQRAMGAAGVSAGPSAAAKPKAAVMKRTGVDDRGKSTGTSLATSEPTVGPRGPGRPPGGSGRPKSSAPEPRQYDSPEDYAAQQAKTAATAAMRPDRAGTQANVPSRQSVSAKPGERPTHDVGTAGQAPGSMPGHTRQPQQQPSQGGDKGETAAQRLDRLQGLLQKDPSHPQADKIKKAIFNLQRHAADDHLSGPESQPSTLGKELEPLKAREKELTRQVNGLNADPKKNANAINKARTELGDVQQKIARLTAAGQSGLEDLQKRVDYITNTYGDEQGDQLARKLGVPTTKQRSRKVKDPKTGLAMKDPKTGKDKIVQQIWSAEKVAKFLNAEPELPAGTYDPAPVQGADRDSDAPWQKGQKLPDPGEKPSSSGRAPLRKPMMKVKDPKTGVEVMEVRPGNFIGQRWKPAGVSQKKATTRADQASGNFKYGSRFSNPAEEGQEVVWDGDDWVLPSQWAAKKAEMAADGYVLDGERRHWISGAQNVQGSPVSTDANTQKAVDMGKARHGMDAPNKDVFGKHRDVKKTVGKAFDD